MPEAEDDFDMRARSGLLADSTVPDATEAMPVPAARAAGAVASVLAAVAQVVAAGGVALPGRGSAEAADKAADEVEIGFALEAIPSALLIDLLTVMRRSGADDASVPGAAHHPREPFISLTGSSAAAAEDRDSTDKTAPLTDAAYTFAHVISAALMRKRTPVS
jgi:hypothetical protein